ncbi:Holliday junction ATP-dependent DNA helicase RuvA [Spirochaetia bacterium]|nr:Holliday junction ATP-dependent DNA helicase RuvA [Spirochaetia bacterium]
MFNSIRGIISEKQGDILRLETAGIEWDIAMPATDVESMPQVGTECRVFIWLYHKEDAVRLFGFASETRRETFFELLKVEGIGPRSALKIMGGISQSDLEQALENEDLHRLERIPGLGKKTAQKMILALKGKLVQSSEAHSGKYHELTEALVAMGFDRKAAEDALTQAASTAGSEQEMLKLAIVSLSGRK